MADLAAAGRAHAAGLAHRVGREVVVQHEVFAILALERVDDLLVLAGAQRGHDESLGLAAGEQRRAVGARQHAHFGHDRAHRLGVAAVDALAGVEDRRCARPRPRARRIARRQAARAAASSSNSFLASRLDGRRRWSGAPASWSRRRPRRSLARVSALSLAATVLEASDGSVSGQRLLGACSASSMMASITGWKERWPNMTAPSMTSSASSLASNSTISTPSWVPATTRSRALVLELVDGRIEDVLAVDIADAGAADRAHERHAADGQRRGGGDQRDDVGIVLEVVGEHGARRPASRCDSPRGTADGSGGRSGARSAPPSRTAGPRA